MKIHVIGNSPTQTDEYQLERRATELKRSGDLAGANQGASGGANKQDGWRACMMMQR